MNRSGYTTGKLEFFAVCLAIVTVFLMLGAIGKNATKASENFCSQCHDWTFVVP